MERNKDKREKDNIILETNNMIVKIWYIYFKLDIVIDV
jgi:hypothetical protein